MLLTTLSIDSFSSFISVTLLSDLINALNNKFNPKHIIKVNPNCLIINLKSNLFFLSYILFKVLSVKKKALITINKTTSKIKKENFIIDKL